MRTKKQVVVPPTPTKADKAADVVGRILNAGLCALDFLSAIRGHNLMIPENSLTDSVQWKDKLLPSEYLIVKRAEDARLRTKAEAHLRMAKRKLSKD